MFAVVGFSRSVMLTVFEKRNAATSVMTDMQDCCENVKFAAFCQLPHARGVVSPFQSAVRKLRLLCSLTPPESSASFFVQKFRVMVTYFFGL